MEHCFERCEFPKKSLRVLAHHKNADGSSALFAKRRKSSPCCAWRTAKSPRLTAPRRRSRASRCRMLPEHTFAVLLLYQCAIIDAEYRPISTANKVCLVNRITSTF